MKQIFKKPSYYLLSQAMDGDEKAIEKILAFYDPYISKCCLRPLYDEYGKPKMFMLSSLHRQSR